MEDKEKKCSSKEHKEINAILYCQDCKIYLCNKCDNFHSKLFENHDLINLDNNINDIFSKFCREKNHLEILKFYCKTHNKLCCASCLCKIKNKEYGQHSNCSICTIEEIKDEKKATLKENIQTLELLSKNINKSIEHLKIIFEKIQKSKEDLTINVQKIFTKIRNILNEREDELILEIEKKYDEMFFKEDFIKESENLPKKINECLENGKIIDEEWNNNTKINKLINNCINIENNIDSINIINENIKKYNNLTNINITFENGGEKEIKNISEIIKKFGKIVVNDDDFKNSKIIDKIDYIKSIKNWINPDSDIRAKLLYRLTDNGEKVSTFHELCDNKSPTLILFHVSDGNKVGIYTPLSWESNTKTKNDAETFIFSLNQNKKCKKVDNNISIYCDKSYGPHANCFGYYQINTMKKIIHYSTYINQAFENGSGILPSNGENKYYELIETEVFKISKI